MYYFNHYFLPYDTTFDCLFVTNITIKDIVITKN